MSQSISLNEGRLQPDDYVMFCETGNHTIPVDEEDEAVHHEESGETECVQLTSPP